MGIGYAIPVSIARQVMEQIIKKGSVTRGWVGVGVQDITKELAESFKLGATGGVLISHVERGGPAFSGGLQPTSPSASSPASTRFMGGPPPR